MLYLRHGISPSHHWEESERRAGYPPDPAVRPPSVTGPSEATALAPHAVLAIAAAAATAIAAAEVAALPASAACLVMVFLTVPQANLFFSAARAAALATCLLYTSPSPRD